MIKWIATLLVVMSFSIIALDALNFSLMQANAQLKWQKEVLANLTAEQKDVAAKIEGTVHQLTRELTTLKTLQTHKNKGIATVMIVMALAGILFFFNNKLGKNDALILLMSLLISMSSPYLVTLIFTSNFPQSSKGVSSISSAYFFFFGILAPLFFYLPIIVQNKIERNGAINAPWIRTMLKSVFVLVIATSIILVLAILAVPDVSGFKN